ncbi:hypothetical protein Tco_0122807 [Tanacetum coccineum]
MSFSKCQGNDVVCYTKPLDSLKSWNDRFFWVDAFACPASFPWNSSKSVSKDPFSKSFEFNAEHYATLVAYPAPFHKYPEPFLCLIGISQMDLLSFIQTVDPTKVRVGERQRAEDEPKLLDTTVGRVVPLLPIAPARAKSELDASVDRLFDEGGSGNLAEQGDSASGGHVVGIPLVSEAAETVVEDVAPLQPKRQRKRKTIVSDAGGPSHPPKKLREDHGTSTGPSVAGKSMSALQRLLAGVVLNPEVRIAALPTLPFITSSVSVTLERESEDQTDSMAGANLRTITAPPRFVISSDSSHHSGANIAEAEVDSFARPFIPLMTVATAVNSTVDPATTVKEKFVESSVFGGDSSGGGADHTVGGFSDLTGSDFIVGGIRTVISPDTDLQKVYVPQWSVTSGSCLDDGCTCREMVDEFAPPKGCSPNVPQSAEAIRLCAEASKFEAIKKSLQGEVRALKDYNTTLEKEKSELDVKVADLVASVKVKEQQTADLDAMVHELETSSAVLQEKVVAYENYMGKLEEFQNEQIRVMNDKFKKLNVDFVEMALHFEEKLYPLLLTTIAGLAINRAIEKGMQDGLAARITHGQEGRVLIDIVVFNPSAESDYISALQKLQEVNFSLLTELKSNKDASTKTLMNILHLDEPLAEILSLDECNLMDNNANHNVKLMRVVPLVEPLSSAALEGLEGTSGTAPETTTTLSLLLFYKLHSSISTGRL